jgi:GTPase SAR1 family protein
MGNLLNRDALLAKQTLKIEKVEFDDGDYVFVREMTGHERDVFENSLLKKIRNSKGDILRYEQSTEDFRAKLAVLTICDDKGESILQPGDYPLLSKNMGIKKLETIINKAQELNKISDEDKENLLKNSEVGLADNSNSDFAGNLA